MNVLTHDKLSYKQYKDMGMYESLPHPSKKSEVQLFFYFLIFCIAWEETVFFCSINQLLQFMRLTVLQLNFLRCNESNLCFYDKTIWN